MSSGNRLALPVLSGAEPDADSFFDSHTLEDLYQEIREVYRSDERPWIVGYSGGKDSTTALQLIWYALVGLPEHERSKPVYVIASDTKVETPVIVDYIDTTLDRINQAAAVHKLPFRAEKVQPTIDASFWVNLIGRGYPAPSSRFRWCTERLKIFPANDFIRSRVAEHGSVVVILGVRRGESATRDQVMQLHRIKGRKLSRHSSLANAFVYTPIEHFSVQDVWSYLIQVRSPWGNDNQDLLDLYRNAQAGECPLVIDDTTPSCGNSRFGCWVCTVVEKDQSMESLVSSGEEWLEPLLDFRNYLAGTQDRSRKTELREYKRKNGRVSFRDDGSIIPGPYSLDTCRALLHRLLTIEKEVREAAPAEDFEAISTDEIHEIRRIWRMERQDWQDSVPQIYREVRGEELEWLHDDTGTFNQRDQQLLEQACREADIPPALVAKLLDIERSLMGMNRRSSVYQQIDTVFREEWRSAEEVQAEHAANLEKRK